MQTKKLLIAYFIIVFLITPVATMSVTSHETSLPEWNKNWSYRQEIILPIGTQDSFAKYQPIDLHIEFSNPCWAKSEELHSIRVCYWDGDRWNEIESQIYDLNFRSSQELSKCGVVFLVPERAYGEERYFIYYDDSEKPAPGYTDHVTISDEYYYYEPISGIVLEGDYYQIKDDGKGVYAIGQKGNIINRALSQVVMKMKKDSDEFDVSNSDNIAALSFVYNVGPKDEDVVASDAKLISKDIRVDGNLMTEFVIVSESKGGEVRTTNIYKYYHCPTENKRISVHMKHQLFDDGIVSGQLDSDGAYGGLITFKSRSSRIQRMQFGEIYPYLHVFGEDNQIKEYKLNTNPESKTREWTVPTTDDCDLGENAWLSYDEGESGKAFGMIFSSNENIVKHGKNERDGIQIKNMEKEYLDVLGAEIDFSAVMFGRNSYERGGSHDLKIPKDLIVEFDAEVFSTEEGGYNDIIKEREYFKSLVAYRENDDSGSGNDQNILTLTVVPEFTVNFFYLPIIANLTGFTFADIWGELYQDDVLISSGTISKPLFSMPKIKFPKLSPGEYIVKIYRSFGKLKDRVIGMRAVELEQDREISVICTWQRTIRVNLRDQEGRRVEGVEVSLYKNDTRYIKEISDNKNDTSMDVNFDLLYPYTIKANYKGFTIFDEKIGPLQNEIDLDLELYDLKINIEDKLGFSPGVNVRPTLTSPDMDIQTELIPKEVRNGNYLFEKLLPAKYRLFISYGRFSDESYINLPDDGDSSEIKFSAVFDLNTELYDSQGNRIQDANLKIDIERNKKMVYDSISPSTKVTLPPGDYTIKVYSEDKLIATKIIQLTTDKEINIVTKMKSIIPILITSVVIIFILEISAIFLFKRFSLNTFLKLLAISLIILSLVQPWWSLDAQSDYPNAEKCSDMYIAPQVMIECTRYDSSENLELATLPEMFTDFVGTLLLIVCSGIALLGFSFLPNILLKRRYFLILISASIIFITLVALAFSMGMSKITELSLGSLNGKGTLEVILPTGETAFMEATWGLSIGFYLCVASTLILIFAGITDYLRKKKWPKRLFKKK